MSLSKDKASLFATGSQNVAKPKGATTPVSAAKAPAAPPSAPPAAVGPSPSVIRTRGGAVPALSADAKARKIAEARESCDKGTKSLQTSVRT